MTDFTADGDSVGSPSAGDLAVSSIWAGYAAWAGTVRECRAEFVRVARSFGLIPEIIPPPARDDVALLYCLCRRLDDAVDEAESVKCARAELARWRDELHGRAPPRALIAAFLAGVPRTGLSVESLGDLLDGMESDLGVVRLPDDDALLRYAYRVSASVGLMLAPLLGVRGRDAERRVVDFGLALQISNILLGVEGDARRGRVYLPAARLAAAGLDAEDVLKDSTDRRLLPVLEGVAALADKYYRSVELGAALIPLRYRHGVLLLGRVYRELGWRAARGEPAPESPAAFPRDLKMRRLAELVVTGWHPRTLGIVPAPPHDPTLHRAVSGLRGADDGSGSSEVVTEMTFAAPPAEVWRRLMFYEEIGERAPLHLRLLLPVPIGTVGRKSEVGDEARCRYESGHLIKRVTGIDPGRHYRFEVVEQALRIGGGMRLLGGSYTLREVPGGTEIAATTRYLSERRPRWLWKPIESAVCHSFHRHVLGAMHRDLEST